MSQKKIPFYIKLLLVFLVLFAGISILSFFGGGDSPPQAKQESVLALDLKGALIGKSQFLKHLRDYVKSDKIKGVLIRLDSPGGSVAISQEIYSEFRRIKEELKKPVVVSAGAMMASGALYASSGASSVLVNPGTVAGSIGVVVPMVNMEQLYHWAKVEPYSIKTGEFKELGAGYRAMTPRERALFQDLVDELLEQFKKAIVDGRKMSPGELEPYTDARIFSGDTAVSAGFADSIGTYSSAVALIGRLTGLGKDVKLFKPKRGYFDFFNKNIDGQSVFNLNWKGNSAGELENLFYLSRIFFNNSFFNAQPMYIFPSAVGM